MTQQKPQSKNDNNVRKRIATNGEIVAAEHYEGPLPHPQTLEKYDEIVPGSAKLIIEDFQMNTQCIRELREIELKAIIARDVRGQWMAFILAILILILTGCALWLGHVIVAGGAFFTAIGAVIVAFLKK